MVSLPLCKTSESSCGRAWSALQHEKFAQIGEHYELIIPHRIVSTLSDLPLEEEKCLWSLAIERARSAALNNTTGRIGIFVNDGAFSRQTVGHAHIHIIASEDFPVDYEFEYTFLKLRSQFSNAVKNQPCSKQKISFNFGVIEDFMSQRRNIVENSGMHRGFSIYSERALTLADLESSDEHNFLIEEWSPEQPSAYSLTNMLRYVLGLRDSPDGQPIGHFSNFEIKASMEMN